MEQPMIKFSRVLASFLALGLGLFAVVVFMLGFLPASAANLTTNSEAAILVMPWRMTKALIAIAPCEKPSRLPTSTFVWTNARG